MTMCAHRDEAASSVDAGRRPPTWPQLMLPGVLALAAAVRLHWTDYTAVLFPVAVLVALAWVAWTLPRGDRPAFIRRWLGAHLAVAAAVCA